MADVSAVTATWNFGAGSPGITRLWFQELLDSTARQAAVDSVRELLTGFTTVLRTDWSIQVEQTVQNFSLDTGKLTGEAMAGAKPPAILGASAATTNYAGGVGGRILWRTGVVIDGRKVVGRTFVVPLVGAAGTDGLIFTGLVTSVGLKTAAYVAQPSARPVVWHKRFTAPIEPGEPPVYAGGNAVPINSGALQRTVSSLRSRRY